MTYIKEAETFHQAVGYDSEPRISHADSFLVLSRISLVMPPHVDVLVDDSTVAFVTEPSERANLLGGNSGPGLEAAASVHHQSNHTSHPAVVVREQSQGRIVEVALMLALDSAYAEVQDQGPC